MNHIDNVINSWFENQSNEVPDLDRNFNLEMKRLEKTINESSLDLHELDNFLCEIESHQERRKAVKRDRTVIKKGFSFIIS